MKKLLTAIALATLVATPALAAKSSRHGRVLMQDDRSAYGAYGAAAGPAINDGAIGQYRKWDPDPNVRLQLERDRPELY